MHVAHDLEMSCDLGKRFSRKIDILHFIPPLKYYTSKDKTAEKLWKYNTENWKLSKFINKF